MEGLGMTFQEPSPLMEPKIQGDGGDAHAFSLQDVNEDNEIFKEIGIDFENAGLTVLRIERLANLHLYKRYVTERDLISEQRKNVAPDFRLNEKYLYHGTTADKTLICEEGLDSRMSKEGCFGRGIYFSDYPKKCVKYAEKKGNNQSFILLMRVILGESKVYPKGQKDRNLVREPEKKAPYRGHRFYDSVEGCPVNHKEFVVYESRRALVECIITYSKAEQKQTSATGLTSELTSAEDQDASAAQDIYDVDSSDSDSDLTDERKNDEGNSSSDDDYQDTKETVDETGDAKDSKSLHETAEEIIQRKRQEFKDKVGVTDDYIVDHCILKSNLDIPEAIKIYENMPKDVEPKDTEVPATDLKMELEIKGENAAPKPEPPTLDSPEWTKLNEEDKNAIIKGLVEDFLHVTGLEATEDEYARKCLLNAKNNLDLAIVAHFEEISSESGQV